MDIQRPEPKQKISHDAKKVFEGVIFDVYQWEQKMFDGSTATFEKLKRPDTVDVFPVTSDGHIILTKQEQPGGLSFISPPGGRVDPGESFIDAAKRELLEESGYEAEEFVLLDAQQPLTKIDWAIVTLIGKGAKRVSEMNLDAGEKVELLPVTFDELIDIAIGDSFYGRQISNMFIEAKYNPKKRDELQELFAVL